MHFDQNIVFVFILLIIGISRLIGRIVENAREQSQKQNRRPAPPQTKSPPRVAGSKEKTDAERIREFLEALGQPTGTAPPPRVKPRTDIPSRPLAPVQPPPSMRPFSPVVLRPARGKGSRVLPPPVPKSAEPAPFVPTMNEPGAWIAQEEKIEAAATRFRAATADQTTRSIEPTAIANWKELLRSADTVRTAIVLREILGPPRGLRPFESSI